MKATVIPVVTSALGKICKELVKKLEELKIRGHVLIIQSTALLRSAGILKEVLDTWWDTLSSKRPPAYTGLKNPQEIEQVQQQLLYSHRHNHDHD